MNDPDFHEDGSYLSGGTLKGFRPGPTQVLYLDSDSSELTIDSTEYQL